MISGRTGLEAAVKVLEAGGIVAFPTDTVYGLAANALDPGAVARIYAAKGRDYDKPLIVFVGDLNDAGSFAEITPLAKRLAARFLPGPLSLVLKKKPGVLAENVTGEFKTVGIRIPDHSLALDLVAACAFPLAVTSANRSGEPSPRAATDINIPVDLLLSGGDLPNGAESTVVDATGKTPEFLRLGALSRAEVEKASKP